MQYQTVDGEELFEEHQMLFVVGLYDSVVVVVF